MQTVKSEATSLLAQLPDDCSIEDVQYHLYVLEKIRRGLAAIGTDGPVSQQEAEKRLEKWQRWV